MPCMEAHINEEYVEAFRNIEESELYDKCCASWNGGSSGQKWWEVWGLGKSECDFWGRGVVIFFLFGGLTS